MDPSTYLIICLMGLFMGLLFLGVPVGFALGGSAFAITGLAVCLDLIFDIYTGLNFLRFSITVDRVFGIMKSEVLVALPMFILMGNILDQSGVAEKMMRAQQRLLGRVSGGLALGVTLIGILLAASTGIIGASVVLLGTLTLPAMMQAKYAPSFAAGTVCSAGTLGILIPPSIMLILMSAQLDVSTGDLFMGAVFPGLLLSSMYFAFHLRLRSIQTRSRAQTKRYGPFDYPRLDSNAHRDFASGIPNHARVRIDLLRHRNSYRI